MRRNVTGQFELPVTAAEAIGCFTPEGERTWVPGWDPIYPAGERTESPGTVFITADGDVETVWVIENIDRDAYVATYCRVTAGRHAGVVRVSCDDRPNDCCVVLVEYNMTTLRPDRPQVLDAYDDDAFFAMMNEWCARVTAILNT